MSVVLRTVPLRRLASRADQSIAVGLYAWLCVRLLPKTFPPEHLFPLCCCCRKGSSSFSC